MKRSHLRVKFVQMFLLCSFYSIQNVIYVMLVVGRQIHILCLREIYIKQTALSYMIDMF